MRDETIRFTLHARRAGSLIGMTSRKRVVRSSFSTPVQA